MFMKHFVVLLAVALTGCNVAPKQADQPKDIERTYKLPSATEVFNLRTKCTELTDKLVGDSVIGVVGAALQYDVVPHYNSKTNHCYAQDTTLKNFNFVRPKNATYPEIPNNYLSIALYDVQTKEMLYYASQEGDTKTGYDYTKGDTIYLSFEDVSKKMDELMHQD